MGILANLAAKKGAQQTTAMMLEIMKRGKSEDQCKCIDYLYTPDEDTKKGCGSSNKKTKKKGCCGSTPAWDMDDYINHVNTVVNNLNLRERAIAKIGLDESQISEIPPVVLHSFIFRDAQVKSEETNIGGVYRNVSNKYNVTWIFFSAEQIYTYTYYLDTTSDNAVEATKDFFYKDITCIRTEHEVEEHIIKRTTGCGCFGKQKEAYFHRNKEYDTLSITVPNDCYSFSCLTNDTIEQSIQAAKAMIREKKNG